jgi:hypothetical protein
MSYGDMKRDLERVISSAPGLYTQRIYEQLGANNLSDQSHIRTLLRKMAKNKTFLRAPLKVQGAMGKVGRTFCYFPNTDTGRMALQRYTNNPPTTPLPTTGQVRSTTAPSRQPKPSAYGSGRARLTAVRDYINAHPNGVEIGDVYRHLGLTTDGQRAQVRAGLRELADARKVLRVKAHLGAPGRIGPAPYVYFPATPEGREGRERYLSREGTAPQRATAPTRTPTPRQYTRTPTTNGSGQRMVEQLVRITLPTGTEELTATAARQLYDELGELFR